jgi:hypothetical protein
VVDRVTTDFPSRAPIGLILGAVLGVLSVIGTFAVWRKQLSPLESFYIKKYLTPAPPSFNGKFRVKQYRVITVDGQIATAQTIAWATAENTSARYITSEPHLFHEWLRTSVYEGRPATDIIRTPAIFAGLLFLACVITGGYFEYRRKKAAREGQPLRGATTITPREFNRGKKRDGFVFRLR